MYTVKETITTITSEPTKTKTSYGNWVVTADAHFDNGLKSWDYPSKSYFFWSKSRALEFIQKVKV